VDAALQPQRQAGDRAPVGPAVTPEQVDDAVFDLQQRGNPLSLEPGLQFTLIAEVGNAVLIQLLSDEASIVPFGRCTVVVRARSHARECDSIQAHRERDRLLRVHFALLGWWEGTLVIYL
jgi:hypothetical protein